LSNDPLWREVFLDSSSDDESEDDGAFGSGNKNDDMDIY
jgi:hypothetical protein